LGSPGQPWALEIQVVKVGLSGKKIKKMLKNQSCGHLKMSKTLLLKIQILQSLCNLKNAQNWLFEIKNIIFTFLPFVLMLTKHKKLK
jgi:hypothetical protein